MCMSLWRACKRQGKPLLGLHGLLMSALCGASSAASQRRRQTMWQTAHHGSWPLQGGAAGECAAQPREAGSRARAAGAESVQGGSAAGRSACPAQGSSTARCNTGHDRDGTWAGRIRRDTGVHKCLWFNACRHVRRRRHPLSVPACALAGMLLNVQAWPAKSAQRCYNEIALKVAGLHMLAGTSSVWHHPEHALCPHGMRLLHLHAAPMI